MTSRNSQVSGADQDDVFSQDATGSSQKFHNGDSNSTRGMLRNPNEISQGEEESFSSAEMIASVLKLTPHTGNFDFNAMTLFDGRTSINSDSIKIDSQDNHDTELKDAWHTIYADNIPSSKMITGVRPGSMTSITIAYVQNPFKFWFHFGRKNHELDALNDQLKDFYALASLEEKRIPALEINRGKICGARYNELWYRAEVLSKTTTTVKIYLVDYGVTLEIDIDNINYLPLKFAKLPRQAIRGTLVNILPIHRTWSNEAIDKFHLLSKVKNMKAQIWYIEKDWGVYGMDLFSSSISVNQILVDCGLAVAVAPIAKNGAGPKDEIPKGMHGLSSVSEDHADSYSTNKNSYYTASSPMPNSEEEKIERTEKKLSSPPGKLLGKQLQAMTHRSKEFDSDSVVSFSLVNQISHMSTASQISHRSQKSNPCDSGNKIPKYDLKITEKTLTPPHRESLEEQPQAVTGCSKLSESPKNFDEICGLDSQISRSPTNTNAKIEITEDIVCQISGTFDEGSLEQQPQAVTACPERIDRSKEFGFDEIGGLDSLHARSLTYAQFMINARCNSTSSLISHRSQKPKNPSDNNITEYVSGDTNAKIEITEKKEWTPYKKSLKKQPHAVKGRSEITHRPKGFGLDGKFRLKSFVDYQISRYMRSSEFATETLPQIQKPKCNDFGNDVDLLDFAERGFDNNYGRNEITEKKLLPPPYQKPMENQPKAVKGHSELIDRPKKFNSDKNCGFNSLNSQTSTTNNNKVLKLGNIMKCYNIYADEIESYKIFPGIEPGSEEPITIMMNPFQFWFHFGEKNFELDELMESMIDFYSLVPSGAKRIPVSELQLGFICAARYSGYWHRAEVRCLYANSATVLLVDYGIIWNVPFDDIKYLPSQYAQLPRQALMGFLYNVKPIGTKWSRDATELFKSLTTDKCLLAKIVSIDEQEDVFAEKEVIYKMMLTDKMYHLTVDVNRALIHYGYALDASEERVKLPSPQE